MKEEFLQFLWKYQLYDQLETFDGQPIDIINHGSHNGHSGPDFFNAKVKIGEQMWAGNVEIHKQASDWIKHQHHLDRSYDSVVLHVVENNDNPTILRTTGTPIVCAQMKYSKQMEMRYEEMKINSGWIACESKIGAIDNFLVKQMLSRIMVDRLSCFALKIEQELAQCARDWEEVFYIYLLKSFGFSINSLPFEMLAKSLPLRVILKHRANELQVEALVFGQMGLLESTINDDEYYAKLKGEYIYLKKLHGLAPLEPSIWRFMRTRPQNFPTIRSAQLAALLCFHTNLFDRIINTRDPKEFAEIFAKIQPSAYWETHYTFGKTAKPSAKAFGQKSAERLMINLWIPFLFAYAHLNDNYELKETAIDLLEKIGAERNSELDHWKSLGIPINTAFDSQALIHLKREYCDKKRCLTCTVGKIIVEEG